MSYSFAAPTDDDGPAPKRREWRLAKARQLFATFAGFPAPRIATRCIDRVIPEVLVDLGALRGVVYSRDHGGAKRTYIHFMDDPPRLLCDEDGRQLYVLGGNYRVTCRGIEG